MLIGNYKRNKLKKMIKFRTISLLILLIGLGLSTSSFASSFPPKYGSHATIKKSRQKSGHHYKPHHRVKAYHKKHRGQTKHSFLRRR